MREPEKYSEIFRKSTKDPLASIAGKRIRGGRKKLIGSNRSREHEINSGILKNARYSLASVAQKVNR